MNTNSRNINTIFRECKSINSSEIISYISNVISVGYGSGLFCSDPQ